ncbi:MAG: glycoside hydrolase family 127 protein [Verrucomicrobia bacterium]|nr:glycoside hydrolase family 127 protein [Verrucomicrobiota bacterium]
MNPNMIPGAAVPAAAIAGASLLLTLASTSAQPTPWLVKPATPAAQHLFPPGAVRLLDGPFKAMQEVDHAYLLRLEPDRLLAQFRVEAGLAPKAKPYGGWESPAAPGTVRSLAGHSLGHYLSALSLMACATDDPSLRERITYITKELKECQDRRGDGSVVAFPFARELEADIRKGKVETIDNYWAPFYTIHKQLAGLRDAWVNCGDATAKAVLVRLADWCGALVKDLPDERRERMLNCEHGGMAEVLADVYAITGERRFLDFARLYSHRALLDPAADGQDNLTGKHANTQVPKFTGFQRIHELAGDARPGAAAAFFWQTVVNNRTWVNGGNSIHEHFSEPRNMGGDLTHDGGPETCNTYNMLRLTTALYQERPAPAYLDYYEHALFNHILTSQAPLPGEGAMVYYTPMRPGYARSYGTAFNSFWCCTGTGMENHAKYGEFIYTHDSASLSVNLFIASELTWPERGLAVRQETRFPDEATTTLAITKAPAEPVTLRLRHPYWLDGDQLVVTVNGQAVATTSQPGGFAEIKRQFQAGERLSIALPMKLRVVRQAQCPGWVSVFNGPILLAGELGREGLSQPDFIGPYTPIKALLPLNRAPLLVATTDAEVLARIAPVDGRPGVFRTMDLAQPKDVTLAPFYSVHFQRYAIYWQLSDAAHAAALQREVATAERLEQELEASTIDRVRLGEQQPETDHQLRFEKSRSGYGPLGKHFRALDDNGWFSFEMKLPPKGAKTALRLVYWGRDKGPESDLLIDGTVIATAMLKGTDLEDYYGVEYAIPAALLESKAKVTVRVQAKPGKPAATVYDLRVVTQP